MRRIVITILVMFTALASFAQNDLIVGQYIHNQYAINPAFAGNREGVTFFGSWRKQWMGIENTPTSILFTTHAPLKNEKLTIGLQAWNQKIHQTANTGVGVSIGYRTRITPNTWLGLALLPGVSIKSADWTKLNLIDKDDDVFAEKTSCTSPLMGFGATWYGRRHFAGLSVTSLFINNEFDQSASIFAPGDAQYICTGGYLLGDGDIHVQPSAMVSYSKAESTNVTATLSGIYRNFIWLDAAYCTKSEINVGIAIQALPQLRVAYNYGLTTGDLSGHSNGTHEISVQYDLVYLIKTVGPRFF